MVSVGDEAQQSIHRSREAGGWNSQGGEGRKLGEG